MPRVASASCGTRSSARVARFPSVIVAGCSSATHTSGPPSARARQHASCAASRGLRPVDDEGERYNISRAKVDLYHVVLSGGLLMLALGVILTAAAWVRVRVQRHDPAPG